jgi:hypothetical protein
MAKIEISSDGERKGMDCRVDGQPLVGVHWVEATACKEGWTVWQKGGVESGEDPAELARDVADYCGIKAEARKIT